MMMMMTRVLMSRVDVDDSGVNGVHSGWCRPCELEEIMMTLVLTISDHNDDPGVNDDDDDDSGGGSD